MDLPVYQVDAFASQAFEGNPAAIMPLETWLPDEQLQLIAAENNLSETAFFVAQSDGFGLRWFTPAVEVDLCGHATLASAHVLVKHLGHDATPIRFHTRSGELRVAIDGEQIVMDFPAIDVIRCEPSEAVCEALGAQAVEAAEPAVNPWQRIYRFASREIVEALTPDFPALARASDSAIICTAEGGDKDFVSRFFGPQVGIDEDPVTGSAHCSLTPFWAERLGRQRLTARQVSARGGDVDCELREGRVFLRGTGVTVMQGRMML